MVREDAEALERRRAETDSGAGGDKLCYMAFGVVAGFARFVSSCLRALQRTATATFPAPSAELHREGFWEAEMSIEQQASICNTGQYFGAPPPINTAPCREQYALLHSL